jgi:hypothetical protein
VGSPTRYGVFCGHHPEPLQQLGFWLFAYLLGDSVSRPDFAIGESHQPPALQLGALLIAKTAEKFYG